MAEYQPDVVIEIPGNCCDFYDFHKAKDLDEFVNFCYQYVAYV
jgi:hypothetical protein